MMISNFDRISTAFITSTPFTATSTQFQTCSTSSIQRNPLRFNRSRNISAKKRAITSSSSKSTTAEPIPSIPPQKAPAGVFEAAVTLGASKSLLPSWKILLLSVVAGAYISLGGFLALRVGTSVGGLATSLPGIQRLLLGLVGLPTGLLLVILTGGELFTGNTMLLTTALLSKKATLFNLLRNWVISFLGNFLGCLLVVKLILLTGISLTSTGIVGMAMTKVGLSFSQAFWRGVICNWLVCLSIYTANGSSDLTGKFIAVLLPISAFVIMGMEHSVANMFFIPMGIKAGAAITVKSMLINNILPVTLGNIFAGSIFVALVYYLAFGKKK